MHPAEQLAAERTRSHLKLAEQLRCARRLRTLRRARRMELRAERRLITAWRRAAELRDAAQPAGWIARDWGAASSCPCRFQVVPDALELAGHSRAWHAELRHRPGSRGDSVGKGPVLR